jgi:hypothetical protein
MARVRLCVVWMLVWTPCAMATGGVRRIEIRARLRNNTPCAAARQASGGVGGVGIPQSAFFTDDVSACVSGCGQVSNLGGVFAVGLQSTKKVCSPGSWRVCKVHNFVCEIIWCEGRHVGRGQARAAHASDATQGSPFRIACGEATTRATRHTSAATVCRARRGSSNGNHHRHRCPTE